MAALTFTGPAQLSGPNAADFAIPSGDDLCDGQTFASGQACRIGVRFTPGAAGVRSATLTLGANDGANASRVVQLTGTGVGPAAVFSTAPDPGTAGLPIDFDASGSSDSDGSIESYVWSFGDGSTAEGIAPSHVYAAAGTYAVTLTVNGSGGLMAQTTHVVTVERPQTVEFDSTPPLDATVGGPTYTAMAAASSGLSVSFSSATPAVCSLAGASVSFLEPGTCTIYADQPGDSAYSPAARVQQSFQVKRPQTIVFESNAPEQARMAGTPYRVSTLASSGLLVSLFSVTPAVCSASGSTVSFVGTGKCTIEANQQGNAEYAPAPQEQQSFAVGKDGQSIAFLSTAPTAATVGGRAYVVAVASSGLPVSFDSETSAVCTVAGPTVTLTGLGTCTVAAAQAGNSEYEAAQQVRQSFDIAPAPSALLSAPTLAGGGGGFAVDKPSVNRKTGAIALHATAGEPGNIDWIVTFRSRPRGPRHAIGSGCQVGEVEVDNRCAAVQIPFAEGKAAVDAAGVVRLVVDPNASARRALDEYGSLRLTVRVTFTPALGGMPVSRSFSIVAALGRARRHRGKR